MEPAQHLLVDGANVVQAWPELRALAKRDRQAARELLSRRLQVLHDAEHLRVSLVFDGRGSALTIEQPTGAASFVRAYSPAGMTADDVIEQWVGQSRDPTSCLVATDDRAERQTVEALGAASMGAADLAQWVERVTERQAGRLGRRRRANDQTWRQPGPG